MGLKEKQDELIDWLVDNQKRDYLQKGEDFGSCIIAFHGDQATLIPFEARDRKHTNLLLMTLAGMFAAKDVKRYFYFMDTFVTEQTIKIPEGLSEEEKLRIARQIRDTLPENLRDHPQSQEAAIWGVVNQDGLEWHQIQFHDSKTHTFLSRSLSSDDDQGHNVFTKIIKQAGHADFSKLPKFKGYSVGKDDFWDMGLIYFKSIGSETLHFELAEGVQ